MAYAPRTWANGSSPYLNATNLNAMEAGIVAAMMGAVNVKDHGATGDDTADDTAEIQAALDAGAGGVVVIPEGVYKITSALDVSANTLITGRGTIHQATNGTAGLVVASGVTVEGITLKGSRSSAVYNGDENAISAEGASAASRCSGVTVRGVEIHGWGMHGVYGKWLSRFRVEDCYIHDCGYAAIGVMSSEDGVVTGNRIDSIVPGILGNSTEDMYGVYMSHYGGASEATNPRSRRITVANNVISEVPWEAIETHGGSDIAITGNVMWDCRDNVALVGGSYNLAPTNITVTGNVAFNTATTAAQYTRNAGVTVSGVDSTYRCLSITVAGNTFRNIRNGVYAKYTQGLNVSGNTFHETNGEGIHCDGWNANFSFTGNTFTDVWHDGSANDSIAMGFSGYGYDTGLIANNMTVRGTKEANNVNLHAVKVLGNPSGMRLTVLGNDFTASYTPLYSEPGVYCGGFTDQDPVSKPSVSGSRSSNAALASLLTALANMGLITDSTS